MGNSCTCCTSSNGDQVHEDDESIIDDAAAILVADAKLAGSGSGSGSVHSQQGAKGPNQDAAVLSQGYGMQNGALCAVFDGHGGYGHIVSRFIRDNFFSFLLNQRESMEWNEACVTAFQAMDQQIQQLQADFTYSGATAVVVIKQGEDLVIANLGDSLAVLGTLTENGVQATQLTVDLKPDVPAEKERIKQSGGRVLALEHEPHIQRVWRPDEDYPGLAMSRALGDFNMKKYGIIAIPEVSQHHLNPNDHFLVLLLATDGVGDVLSNEEVLSVVQSTA